MSRFEEAQHVTTEDELRALAHPLRLRLLGLLRLDGPSTASALGERLGESSGVTSYHLRYLAERDFVEEAEELGNRRERWWRATHRSTYWDSGDFLESRAGRAADLSFRREALRFTRSVVDNWLIDELTWPRRWVSAAAFTDVLLRLSIDQLEEFGRDYHELLGKYAALSDENEREHAAAVEAAAGDSAVEDAAPQTGLERVYTIMQAVPVRDLNP